ncbi:hypothetical protein CDAR_218461 [Caerostris darwini]|uniref:Uncharacterized protein n=1 Tax=Caerostris darwini TaxID=1538125 RepID=A0AAV4RFE1_9ARAC|nr:hypothetical protein CDAR_218461 [Caerostris darwini]
MIPFMEIENQRIVPTERNSALSQQTLQTRSNNRKSFMHNSKRVNQILTKREQLRSYKSKIKESFQQNGTPRYHSRHYKHGPTIASLFLHNSKRVNQILEKRNNSDPISDFFSSPILIHYPKNEAFNFHSPLHYSIKRLLNNFPRSPIETNTQSTCTSITKPIIVSLSRRIPVHYVRISARKSNFARDLFRDERDSNVQVC